MLNYKIYIIEPFGRQGIIVVNEDGSTSSFLAHVYSQEEQDFKQAILEDQATLEDADGNLLSPAEAKAYVLTLP